METPWVMRAAILIRASAGIMFVISLGTVAGAIIVNDFSCVAQVVFGAIGIAYACFLKDVAETMERLRADRAFIASVVNMFGLPALLAYLVPFDLPRLKLVAVFLFIGLGIASLVSLIKMKLS